LESLGTGLPGLPQKGELLGADEGTPFQQIENGQRMVMRKVKVASGEFHWIVTAVKKVASPVRGYN